MKRNDIFKCPLCGNVIEIRVAAGPVPLCCGEEMKQLEEKSADKTTEKHVPVVEKVEGGYKVTVGSTLHPMTEEHFIGWIELIGEDENAVVYLKPGMDPTCEIKFDKKLIKAREYCNLHGLWKAEE